MSRRAGGFSLRQHLLLTLLGSIAVVWLATAVFSYFDARHELDELLDAHLAQSVALLLAQTGHEPEEIDTEHMAQLHKRARSVAIQMWERGEILRLHSVSAPAERLSPRDEGFSDALIKGERWRVFSAWDAERRYLVQVGERYKTRDEIAASLAKNLLLPLLFALPLLGLLVWLNVARALRPLAALGRQVAGRDPGNLGTLDAGEIPAEVVPLVENLNRLFERVAQLIENERRFTADASHELRTPLAALKTQAQVALASTNDAERRRALDNVIAGCERAAHLVQQLLTLARLDPDQPGNPVEACDLRALASAAVAELAPYALSKDVEIELADGAPVETTGHPGLLAVLLRNLIDNAIRYSPAGGSVHVRAARDGQAATLMVTDRGPGIPADEREKVGRRFYRVLGTEEYGSGLGLSIVKRIAELHGASVSLSEGEQGRGLSVTVAFRSLRS
ncbi:MAG: sensor histidine kinase N-terminal domain-containing protein [Burkholderiales bacterium]|nr:sensor histidine kinase N-terminal domain-containing protein [Burkholderiales bacterium]